LTDTGANATLNIRWGKTAANTWEAYYLSDSAASGSTPKWTSLGAFASFNGLGALITPTPVLKTLTIDGAALTNIPINLTGLTQNATATTITPPTVFDDVDIINPANEAAFLAQTISGGSLNLYDAQGNSQTLQLRWGKTAANTWNAYYLSDSAATGTQPKWTSLGNFATFDTAGKLTTVTPATISPVINGVTFTDIDINLAGTTQYGDTSGLFTGTNVLQDGYATGSPIGLTINESGRIFQSYSNGESIPIAEIAVVNFNGDDALNRIDGGTFEQTDGSGEPIPGLGAASIRSSGVEASNVDIAQEFTKLITTQQAYSANTKVITTSQDLLATTINMVR
jgi:flagellar hook protein FlgE